MRILIIEDEKLASDKLAEMLCELDPSFRIVGQTGSIKESVQWLVHQSADLIFLDIQLSDGISFSIFEQVAVDTPVIFTTAYDQYAMKAFQLNSIAYLLKPIRKADLADSLKKFHSLQSAFRIDFDTLLAHIQGTKPEYKNRFLIQIGDKIRKIEVSETAYFFVLEKGTFLRTRSGNIYPLEYSLDRLSELLNPDKFFRINRKMIVNMDAISNMVAYSRGRVKLGLDPPVDTDEDAIVSIDRSAAFKRWLNS